MLHIYQITQDQWDQMLLEVPRLNARDRRIFEAVLHVFVTAIPWNELPEEVLGVTYRTCWNRHQRWLKEQLWFDVLFSFLGTLSPAEKFLWENRLQQGMQLRNQKYGKRKRPVLTDLV
ncbi:transposase [Deinococcus roseus]|uniref:Insertion element IS402-like domain-containing protein n=1 Tax=Deinococcus roseus TaxID=392414 RepID=A0ABQ2D272_9DEIO|nr:transposase [Deinococcus roseus]GGJ42804.1 hypothetical protein GCM10008938_31220 [Deinococcus roseus]